MVHFRSIGRGAWRVFSLVLGTALTTIIGIWFLRRLDMGSAAAMLKDLSPAAVVASLLFYSAGYLLRALRTHVLLRRAVPFGKVFVISCVHGFVSNVIPWKVGELSHVYLLHGEGVRTTGGIFTLGAARLLDATLVLLMLLACLPFASGAPPLIGRLAGASLALLAAGLGGLLAFRRRLTRMLRRGGGPGCGGKLRAWLAETLEQLTGVESPATVLRLVLTTLLIWGCFMAADYCIVLQFAPVSIFAFVIALGAGALSCFLPVQGFMGFGTVEGVWALTLVSFGYSMEVAVVSGFAAHVLGLIYSAAFGTAGLVYLRRRFWRRQ